MYSIPFDDNRVLLLLAVLNIYDLLSIFVDQLNYILINHYFIFSTYFRHKFVDGCSNTQALITDQQYYEEVIQNQLLQIITHLMQKQENQDGIMDGFSSDEEVKHQEIIIEERKKTEGQVQHKEEVKFKIPPPEEIKAKAYSLNPDMATGWAPKNQLPVPIPMLFDSRRTDTIVKRFLEKKQQKMRLVYLGPRFENTFYAWYDRDFQFPYAHVKAPQGMKFTNRAFCGQHWDANDGLIFDSFFESGNLDLVIQVGEREYDVYIRVDSNTRGHLQWYNFKVTGWQKLQKYKINICNLQKNKSLYSRGQKPYIYSAKKFQKEKKGWQQAGQFIRFEQKPGKSAKVLSCEFTSNYKLSFEYYTEYQNDMVQIAYCIPYTYSELLSEMKNLQNRATTKQFISVTKLCQSLGGLDIPLITIHENYSKEAETKLLSSNNNENTLPRKCIIISGRVHPGQSNGSHMMQGFLEFLCGESKEAILLRQNFVFKIVPMLNPDGVTLGNYRTGISGRDFNRQYRNPDKAIFPEVYAFKKFVIENKTMYRQNLLMFLDFHGHSTKKNVFVYGPQFPIIERHYYECRVFPKILGNHTNMFRYYSCSFKVSEFKETTARAVFLRKVMIPLSYTIEASNGSFYDHDALKDVPFNQGHWVEMGKKVGTALGEYGELIVMSERYKIEKMQSRKAKKDIKIRKNSRGKPMQAQPAQNTSNIEKQITILANKNNDKIKKLFQEIKKAEQQKQLQKNEQDDISEGSSDGQGQKDDLSPQKLHLLFQIIKNKKANISEKHKKRFIEEDPKHSKTNQFEHEQHHYQQQHHLQLEIKPVQMLLPIELDHDQNRDEQIFRPSNHVKGYLLRNRNRESYPHHSEEKKQKVAARIINFSFIGHSKPPISTSVDRRVYVNNRSDVLEISPNKIDRNLIDNIEVKGKSNNFRVLDLSDNSFRQTCTGTTATYDTSSGMKGLIDRKNLTFFNVSPRKLGAARLEDYKYKRLFIDEFKI